MEQTIKGISPIRILALLGCACLLPLAVAKEPETTPRTLPGSEPFIFREVGAVELRLHVVKPEGWKADDARPCFVSFFGGGWTKGTPERVIHWAKWAAAHGMVGIAPDYRTRDRLGGQPEDCIADARAAIDWIAAHAEQLGIDPEKIVVLGSSAGGHVALWTAISAPGPGKDDPAPKVLPAAMVLINPVTDTTDSGYGGVKRFKSEARARACSVNHQMSAAMPPTIVFHATEDELVPYANSVVFRDKMIANGNRCELVTFEGLGHSYYSSNKFGDAGKAAYLRTTKEVNQFLTSLDLIKN